MRQTYLPRARSSYNTNQDSLVIAADFADYIVDGQPLGRIDYTDVKVFLMKLFNDVSKTSNGIPQALESEIDEYDLLKRHKEYVILYCTAVYEHARVQLLQTHGNKELVQHRIRMAINLLSLFIEGVGITTSTDDDTIELEFDDDNTIQATRDSSPINHVNKYYKDHAIALGNNREFQSKIQEYNEFIQHNPILFKWWHNLMATPTHWGMRYGLGLSSVTIVMFSVAMCALKPDLAIEALTNKELMWQWTGIALSIMVISAITSALITKATTHPMFARERQAHNNASKAACIVGFVCMAAMMIPWIKTELGETLIIEVSTSLSSHLGLQSAILGIAALTTIIAAAIPFAEHKYQAHKANQVERV
ncbi:MAG: hypothetical protein JSS50_01595 [Proteobacteria bacterium]|nr:hypothetical protein [Pseudomonadota bacterium]